MDIVWTQCRCDESLVDDAKALRDAFIGGELDKIKVFVTNSADLKVTQGMQAFINKNKQVRLNEIQTQGESTNEACVRELALQLSRAE